MHNTNNIKKTNAQLLDEMWPGASAALIKAGYDPEWTMEVSEANIHDVVSKFYPRLVDNLNDELVKDGVLPFIQQDIGIKISKDILGLQPHYTYLDPVNGKRIHLKLFGAYPQTRKWIDMSSENIKNMIEEKQTNE
jgi:hypothetical protein